MLATHPGNNDYTKETLCEERLREVRFSIASRLHAWVNDVNTKMTIDCFHDPIMQDVLGGSLHKNNTSCLLLGLYHASVN